MSFKKNFQNFFRKIFLIFKIKNNIYRDGGNKIGKHGQKKLSHDKDTEIANLKKRLEELDESSSSNEAEKSPSKDPKSGLPGSKLAYFIHSFSICILSKSLSLIRTIIIFYK